MEGPRAIDKTARNRHETIMRYWIIIAAILWVPTAWAEPERMCSTEKWEHTHCVRPAHFVYDTCNAIAVFSDRHGLDRGFFARLIWQESRFDPNALSPANARGIAQFIPSTASLRGLADPYNPADALEHSAQYLAEMAGKYGSLGLAAIELMAGNGAQQGF